MPLLLFRLWFSSITLDNAARVTALSVINYPFEAAFSNSYIINRQQGQRLEGLAQYYRTHRGTQQEWACHWNNLQDLRPEDPRRHSRPHRGSRQERGSPAAWQAQLARLQPVSAGLQPEFHKLFHLQPLQRLTHLRYQGRLFRLRGPAA